MRKETALASRQRPAAAARTVPGPATAPAARQEKGLVKSSTRSLQVFEFFQQFGRPARTVEIGRFLDIPNSSADELLKTLAELGYLTFNQRTKCYAPSYRFFNLSKGLENQFFMDGRIGDMMRYLAETSARPCPWRRRTATSCSRWRPLSGAFRSRTGSTAAAG